MLIVESQTESDLVRSNVRHLYVRLVFQVILKWFQGSHIENIELEFYEL